MTPQLASKPISMRFSALLPWTKIIQEKSHVLIEKRKKISDIISVNDAEKWSPGNVVTIVAGTGSGKSYFIKNTLVDVARRHNKKILMFIHRKRCVEQFSEEIKTDFKSDVISIRTYQSLEVDVNDGRYVDLNDYDYIVCDEFHYFTSDSPFNQSTDISFKKILSQDNAVIIMMSATAWDINTYIKLSHPHVKAINYVLPPDFSFVRNLYFFNKESTLYTLAEEIVNSPDGCKGIFFLQRAESAWDLHKAFKNDSIFCRGGNKKYVDEAAISNMLKEQRFKERFLVTTSCLDAGVNIVDTKVTKIVVQMSDVTTLIQCIGRKRIQGEDDKVDIYIFNYPNPRLNGFRAYAEMRIEKARYFKEFGAAEYNKKYYRMSDRHNMVYEEVRDNGMLERKVNELMYYKANKDILNYTNMISLGEHGYCKKISEILHRFDPVSRSYNYCVYQEPYSLEDYLRENINTYLYGREDRNTLIKMVDTISGKRQLKSIAAINASLHERRLKYKITEHDVTVHGKRYRHAWKIEKIN